MFGAMKPKTLLSLLGTGALLIGMGVAIQAASANDGPELTAEYTEAGLWGGGLIGSFTIRNPSTKAIDNWQLQFGLSDGGKIAGVWSGTLSVSNGTYIIKPTQQTKYLPAHGSLSVGFTVWTSNHVVPTNCVINGKKCTVTNAPPGKLDTGPADVPPQAAGDNPAPADPAAPDQHNGAPAKPKGGKSNDGTDFSPSVNLTASDRPPLTTLATASGSELLTLVSAIPTVGSGCDLKWGGTADLSAYTREITDALRSGVSLIGSIAGSGGLDIAQACGTVAALEGQLRELLQLGIRSLDFTIPSAMLTNAAANLRRALAIKDLKAQFSGLSVSYTLPFDVGASIDTLTSTLASPLTAIRSAGAILDGVNILPVDLGASAGLLGSVLSTLGLGNTLNGLLAMAKAMHTQLMSTLGLGAAAAWHTLGIVPVIGGGELVSANGLVGEVTKLTDFAKANGLGLLGFLPLGTNSSCGAGGGLLGLNLPILNCLDPAVLSHFLGVTNLFTNALQ
jgi:hypothetical protein